MTLSMGPPCPRMLIVSEDADVDTGLGVMRCKVFRPQDVSRRWPALVLWAEIFSITGPITRSAQVFAGHGFVVVVPEFYHPFLAPGAALQYTPEDTAKGNAFKLEKELASYDADIAAAIAFALACPHANGAVGTVGFCLGGALAFRAALHPAVQAAVCWYATDVHKGGLSKTGDDSLARVAEIRGEIVMIYGRQDPHVPQEGRDRVRAALAAAGTRHQFLEVRLARGGCARDPSLCLLPPPSPTPSSPAAP
jgi:carboxymethylenebutenolidase